MKAVSTSMAAACREEQGGGARPLWLDPIVVAAALLAALLVLAPVLVRAGWPHNHDGLTSVARMTAIVGQWRLGHLIPVWSTTEQWGMGSPAPALYHKVFLYLSSAVFMLTGSPKAGYCVALFLLMVLAFLGTAAALRTALGRRARLAECVAGALTISCNYATTDWFIRGAYAEFAALAVSTWLFAWCIALIVRGRWQLWIGPVMAALMVSHAAIALFSPIPLLVAFGIACWRWRRHTRSWIAPAIASIAIAVILAAPFELPLLALAGFNRQDALFVPSYTPWGSHVVFARYFLDTAYKWGRRWQTYTVQIDAGLLVGAACFAVLLPVVLLGRTRGALRPGRGLGAVGAFLALTVGLMMVLQTRAAYPFYQLVPGARFIQFAWRLMTFVSIALAITTGLAVAVLQELGRARQKSLARALAAGAVILGLGTVVSTGRNKPWWTHARYGWWSAQDMREALGWDPVVGGEYLPRTTIPDLQAARKDIASLPGRRTPPECDVTGKGAGERAVLRFTVVCPRAASVALPVFAVIGARATPAAAVPPRGCADPRLHVAVPAGTTPVAVRMPSWTSMMGQWIAGGRGFDLDSSCPAGPYR